MSRFLPIITIITIYYHKHLLITSYSDISDIRNTFPNNFKLLLSTTTIFSRDGGFTDSSADRNSTLPSFAIFQFTDALTTSYFLQIYGPAFTPPSSFHTSFSPSKSPRVYFYLFVTSFQQINAKQN
ncbi:hypothetical protein AX774_g5320 [Zancudomyces culisetae]|uniref:Uncharacterized protein n=1 Tax=Zancudomyces culisetae TaxID=1213189 RepID=A0A1R1PJU4_ZANCU|nr:hypothetical protein AX774_g5320 [Zancudomyces culisetae]|eukprot:OMH81234.1 hypothetical protein AX774_g5320 [Zancudomyces culisetae]